MQHHKIVITGPAGVGKTTAIGSISDELPVATDAAVAPDAGAAPGTAVRMDYGAMDLGGDDRLHLFGTQGQERFDFLWDTITADAIGLVLLLSNARPQPLEDLEHFLGQFRPFIDASAVVIGVTHVDMARQPRPEQYQARARQLGLEVAVPVFEVDPRQRGDVAVLLQALLYSLDPGLQA